MKLTGRGRNTFKGIYYDAFKDTFYYLEILIQHRKFFKQTCKGHKSPIKFKLHPSTASMQAILYLHHIQILY